MNFILTEEQMQDARITGSSSASVGGYILPQYIKVKKRGLKAWLYRVLRDGRGWELKSTFEILMSEASKPR